MCRVDGWRFSRSSTVQPSITGRLMSSTIASGLNSRASASPVSPRSATIPLKPRSRAISSSVRAKSASSSTIRTTRSPASIASRSSSTSLGTSSDRIEVVDVRLAAVRRVGQRRRRRGQPRRDGGQELRAGGFGRVLDEDVRQVERERAALAGRRLDVDLAAEQARDLAADREAEPGAAVAAARRPVRLLERLEDHPQLVGGDPDARVHDREPEHVRRRSRASRWRTGVPGATGRPAGSRRPPR